MNTAMLISAAILACMCIGSDAFAPRLRRISNPTATVPRVRTRPRINAEMPTNARSPTIIVIREPSRTEANAPAQAAPAPATTVAHTGGTARRTSGTHQPGIDSFTRSLLFADLFDTPFIPHGINPSSYFLLNGGNDFPFLPFLGGAGKSHGASAQPGLQSLLLAQSLDMPFPFMF